MIAFFLGNLVRVLNKVLGISILVLMFSSFHILIFKILNSLDGISFCNSISLILLALLQYVVLLDYKSEFVVALGGQISS